MRILIFIPVWKRPEITEICFQGVSRLRDYNPRYEIDCLAVVSEKSMIGLCKKYKIQHTFFDNNPLGAKKNHGLNVALKKDFDYLMELNSDDIIKGELLDIYYPYFEKKVPMIGITNFLMINSEDGDCIQYHSPKTLYGIARCYSKQAIKKAAKVVKARAKVTFYSHSLSASQGDEFTIESVNYDKMKPHLDRIGKYKYELWDNEADKGMDNFSALRFQNTGIEPVRLFTDEPMAIDIKSNINIWPFSHYRGVKYDLKEALEGVEDIRHLWH